MVDLHTRSKAGLSTASSPALLPHTLVGVSSAQTGTATPRGLVGKGAAVAEWAKLQAEQVSRLSAEVDSVKSSLLDLRQSLNGMAQGELIYPSPNAHVLTPMNMGQVPNASENNQVRAPSQHSGEVQVAARDNADLFHSAKLSGSIADFASGLSKITRVTDGPPVGSGGGSGTLTGPGSPQTSEKPDRPSVPAVVTSIVDTASPYMVMTPKSTDIEVNVAKIAPRTATDRYQANGRSFTTILDADVVPHQPGFIAEILPLNWPSALPMREGLDSASLMPWGLTFHREATCRRWLLNTDASGKSFGKSVGKEHSCMCRKLRRAGSDLWRGIKDPESRLGVARTVSSTVLLIYEAAVIPYMLGFDVPLEGWWVQQLLFMACFWTLDMCWSFVQGFERDGALINDAKMIRLHYLKTDFPLDIFVIILDWTTVTLLQFTQLEVVARVLRLMRMSGLLRLQKLTKIVVLHLLTADVDAFRSVSLIILVILGILVLLNHFQTCVWAYVGKHATSDTGAHWVDRTVEVGTGFVPFDDLNTVYKYTSVFHWHIAQLTVGNQEIYCSNTVERIVNIMGLLFALMMACTVVSMLSATLVSFQISVKSRTKQLQALHQYLRDNRVSHKTFLAVVRQARARVQKSARLREKDVSALTWLSPVLQNQLRYEIFLPFLQSHGFLRLWTRLDNLSVQQLCQIAAEVETVLPQDELFQAGKEATKIYHLRDGKGEYKQFPESSAVSEQRSVDVVGPRWLSEAALWTQWIHVGSFEAVAPSEVFSLNCTKWVAAIPATHHALREVVADYAAQFARRMGVSVPPIALWPDDLEVPCTDFGSIVASMQRRSQEIIAVDALSEATSMHQLSSKVLFRLEEQVMNGQCAIFYDNKNSHQQLKRVTSGVSLEIQRSDGKSLFQLGKIRDGEAFLSIMVPGIMCERHELPAEAVTRLVETKLRPLARAVKLQAPVLEVETRTSQDIGVLTDYIQLRYLGELQEDFQIPNRYQVSDGTTFMSELAMATPTRLNIFHSQNEDGCPGMLESYMFPVLDKKFTNHVFAWMTKADFEWLKRHPEVALRWLRSNSGRDAGVQQTDSLNGDSSEGSHHEDMVFIDTDVPGFHVVEGGAALNTWLSLNDSFDGSPRQSSSCGAPKEVEEHADPPGTSEVFTVAA